MGAYSLGCGLLSLASFSRSRSDCAPRRVLSLSARILQVSKLSCHVAPPVSIMLAEPRLACHKSMPVDCLDAASTLLFTRQWPWTRGYNTKPLGSDGSRIQKALTAQSGWHRQPMRPCSQDSGFSVPGFDCAIRVKGPGMVKSVMPMQPHHGVSQCRDLPSDVRFPRLFMADLWAGQDARGW